MFLSSVDSYFIAFHNEMFSLRERRVGFDSENTFIFDLLSVNKVNGCLWQI